MTTVYYNGVDPFSGLAPTPLVGISQTPIRYLNRWGTVEKVTLEGTITGMCESFADIVDKQNQLISAFSSQCYANFAILEDGGIVFSYDVARVKQISFPNSYYSQLLPFTVEIELYNSGTFSGFYGVTEPVNQFSFDRKDNKVVGLSHEISAKGFRNLDDPLTNAKNYVLSLTGLSSAPTPIFVDAVTNPILKTVEESINRFEGTYKVNEIWSYDPEIAGSGILRYTTELTSGYEDGITKIQIQGSIEGGENCQIDALRTRYGSINFNGIAGQVYSGFVNGVINSYPLTYEIEENSFRKQINFSIAYDDNPFPNPLIVDTTQLTDSSLQQGVISVDALFKWVGDCKCNNEYGWNQLLAAVNSYNFASRASSKWAQYGHSTSINPNPTQKSISQNKSNCEISVKMVFDEVYNSVPSGFDTFEYNVSIRPALLAHSTAASMTVGQYIVTNLGYNKRAKYSINGRARLTDCADKASGESLVKSAIIPIMNQVVVGSDILLETDTVTFLEGEAGKLVSFNFSWSAESTPII